MLYTMTRSVRHTLDCDKVYETYFLSLFQHLPVASPKLAKDTEGDMGHVVRGVPQTVPQCLQ